MGSLTVPTSGAVYIDTQIVIYTVQKHPTYLPMLRPLWVAARSGQVQVVTTEFTVLETLVVPMRMKNQALQLDYENLLLLPPVQLMPLTRAIFYEAARLRANHAQLKTPDAVHAATANISGARLFLTNDRAFRTITSLSMPVTILDEVTP